MISYEYYVNGWNNEIYLDTHHDKVVTLEPNRTIPKHDLIQSIYVILIKC